VAFIENLNRANEGIKFTSDLEAHFASYAVEELQDQLEKLRDKIRSEFPRNWMPQDLVNAIQGLGKIRQNLVFRPNGGVPLPCNIQSEEFPLLYVAIDEHIARLTIAKDDSASLSNNEEPQLKLQSEIEIGHQILGRPPLIDVRERPTFTLAQYLNLETIARIDGDKANLTQRIYDEKFHTLMSQRLFIEDLRYFLEQCFLRDRPVSAAYIDIDKFKKINQEYHGGETQVDKDILPRFMGALEAFVFGRGYAYREGGDEYLVLLPNTGNSEALSFFDNLRKHLAEVKYPNNFDGPTVSIGVCTVEKGYRLTPRQIQGYANMAKTFAKDERNRVAGFESGKQISKETLMIFKSEPDINSGKSST
jgi:diguanylate cyclase (GGDEF)-like protein